jgi:hypothetical protein
LSLEQVDDMYNDVGGIWGAHRSKKWEPKETWEQRKSMAAQGGRGVPGGARAADRSTDDDEAVGGVREPKDEGLAGHGAEADHVDRVA